MTGQTEHTEKEMLKQFHKSVETIFLNTDSPNYQDAANVFFIHKLSELTEKIERLEWICSVLTNKEI